MNVHVVRADFGRYTEAFEFNNYIGIGWFDFEINNSNSREEIKEFYRQKYPDDSNMRVNQNAGQVYRFINDLKIDDIIITPFSNNQLLIGKIEGDVYLEIDNTSPYPIRKKVNWFENKLDRTTLSIPLQNSLRSSLTVFTLRQAREILLNYNLMNTSDTEVRTEINLYEIIKEKLNQLDGFEFEIFVSYLLQTIGFIKTDEVQGGVGDGGIDFEGVLNIYGIASVNLQVQVKSFENSAINQSTIASFRGAMKRDYQGCFITLSKFTQGAINNANDTNKIPITLIDGKKLIDIFINQYDEIISAMREDDNDELADKLKFKKALIPY